MNTCKHLGQKTGATVPHHGTRGLFVYKCTHPNHQETTLLSCAVCADSTALPCLPCFKPEKTPESIKKLLRGPPATWQSGWQSWPNVQQAFREMFSEAADEAYRQLSPAWEYLRGIVICAGGWSFFPGAYVICRLLRRLGCDLPIEIWHLKGERDERMTTLTERIGGITWMSSDLIRADRFRQITGIDDGWALKPFAAAYSKAAEVIYLDADCCPIYNPVALLDHHEYRRAGACFWPDQMTVAQSVLDLFGVQSRKASKALPSIESGQFIVDKRRHWAPMWLACWLASYRDYVWQPHGPQRQGHIYGDTNVYNLAWHKLSYDFAFATMRPQLTSWGYIQRDFDRRPAFAHRCRDKFRVSGQIDGRQLIHHYSTPQDNVQRDDIPHAKFCREALEECAGALGLQVL